MGYISGIRKRLVLRLVYFFRIEVWVFLVNGEVRFFVFLVFFGGLVFNLF